jgi:hypothetical protein
MLGFSGQDAGVIFIASFSVVFCHSQFVLAGTVRYGMFCKPVVLEKPLWVFYTVLCFQGMLCIPCDIRPGSSLLEQRKLEIFLHGMQTWIVPWSGLLEGCCHVVVSWWSDVWLRWVKSKLLLLGVV